MDEECLEARLRATKGRTGVLYRERLVNMVVLCATAVPKEEPRAASGNVALCKAGGDAGGPRLAPASRCPCALQKGESSRGC